MIYNKSVWEDRIVQYPNRYKDQNDNLIFLTQEPGEVAQVGTLVEAEKMNNIENAIEQLAENELTAKTLTNNELSNYILPESNRFLVNETSKEAIPLFEDYTTNEQLIGIWRNGKKKYKKIYYLQPSTTPFLNDASYDLNISSLNIDELIHLEAKTSYTVNNVLYDVENGYSTPGNRDDDYFMCMKRDNVIRIRRGSIQTSATQHYTKIELIYTKKS